MYIHAYLLQIPPLNLETTNWKNEAIRLIIQIKLNKDYNHQRCIDAFNRPIYIFKKYKNMV